MTIIERLASIQQALGAIAALPATLNQIAADLAAIKAAQGVNNTQALDDIKAIVINIQAEIGSE